MVKQNQEYKNERYNYLQFKKKSVFLIRIPQKRKKDCNENVAKRPGLYGQWGH